ncbi:MAG: hemerythrin family protein [Oleiphilaceae bacterium]|nr:hemerythrin family protein [Oleiphilaceae bacterium]
MRLSKPRSGANAEHHFMLEEAYMQALDYPQPAQHVATHNRFRDEINQLVHAPELSDTKLRQSLSTFLREWLIRHVMGVDKDFERFVLDSNVK